MSENPVMLDIQSLVEEAEAVFAEKNPTFEEVELWLQQATNIPTSEAVPEDYRSLIVAGRHHTARRLVELDSARHLW